MLNGTMDKRTHFIDAVTSKKEINALWIIRGEKVIQEYGEGSLKEQPRDEIDKQVLKTGKIYTQINDDMFSSNSSIRITIPYKATHNGRINCFQCHNVNNNDVLGAISIELDISQIKQMGKESLYLIIIATTILIFLIILVTNAILKPYIETFERIGFSVKDSAVGKFNNIIKPKGLTKGKEVDILIDDYNYFIDELQHSFSNIDTKLRSFTGITVDSSHNIFLHTANIINNLSDIYNFKKQIELDTTLDEIYNRLAQILVHKFNITQFSFMFFDSSNNTSHTILLEGEDSNQCNLQQDFNLCRAYATTQDVYSISDHKACACYDDAKERLHYCLYFKLMDNTSLVVKLLVNNKEELELLQNLNISFIKKYFQEAIPTLKVKYILNELNNSVFKDALTGLYNRKFFDEELDVLVSLAKREKFTIAVLMLDMDHFKEVNDKYGHDVGDQVLQMFASTIKSSIRESDIAIRIGGEEFIVLLMNTNEQNAINVANKIRQNVANTAVKLPNNENLYKTTSIGVSMFPQDINDINKVVINADTSLYVAKDTGRNKVVKFHQDMDKKNS